MGTFKPSSGSLVLVLLLMVLPAHAAPKNESTIHVEGATKIQNDQERKLDKSGDAIPGTSVIRWCTGSAPTKVDLKKAGISASDLKKGVSCIVEDFDGNGYLDFVLFQPPPPSDGKWHARSAIVLFYKGAEVIKSQITSEFELFQPTDRERNNYPNYRGRAGLINHAEGDAGSVSFFSPATGQFEEAPYVYPKGYD